jgi:hypothetical protein
MQAQEIFSSSKDVLLMLGGAALGWIVSVIIARAKVEASIEPPYTAMHTGSGPYTAVRLLISNKARWWTLRAPAVRCRGSVTFYNDRGYQVFRKPMNGRWSNAPQPEPQILHMTNGTCIVQLPIDRYDRESRMDIYPGKDENEPLDVAARWPGDAECYAWCNEAYLVANGKNPDWKLDRGIYFVMVIINISGRDDKFYFRLHNDGPVTLFRLEKTTRREIKLIVKNRQS